MLSDELRERAKSAIEKELNNSRTTHLALAFKFCFAGRGSIFDFSNLLDKKTRHGPNRTRTAGNRTSDEVSIVSHAKE